MKNYLDSWNRVIPVNTLSNILRKISKVNDLCPNADLVFEAFKYCDYNKLKVVIIGQDPYFQKDMATGIAFGNNHFPISPSLRVLTEGCIDAHKDNGIIDFDYTLKSWAEQGVLLLNGALTCELNKPKSHLIIWRPFITKLLSNLSHHETNIVYVLLGDYAKTLKPYIDKEHNIIIEEKHPAFFARFNKNFPHKVFNDINYFVTLQYGTPIKWYQEY